MNGQNPPQEPVKIDAKKELAKSKTQLFNLNFSRQILEAQVKKLEELAR